MYAEMTAALYRSISDVSGKTVILDSSKKPLRTYALLATGTVDVRVLHLVRDGRGVVWSRLKSLPRDVEARCTVGAPLDTRVADDAPLDPSQRRERMGDPTSGRLECCSHHI